MTGSGLSCSKKLAAEVLHNLPTEEKRKGIAVVEEGPVIGEFREVNSGRSRGRFGCVVRAMMQVRWLVNDCDAYL